jgi:hypothetical protein
MNKVNRSPEQSKPPSRFGALTFAALKARIVPGRLPATVVHDVAAPAGTPQHRRSVSAAALDVALTLAHLVGLGKRPMPGSTAQAPVAPTEPSKAPPKPARPDPPIPATPRPPRPTLARPLVPAVTAQARRLAQARAAAHAQGVAAGRMEVRQRGLAIFEAVSATRGTVGLNLPALIDLAADTSVPVGSAAVLLARLSPLGYHAARAARNSDVVVGGPPLVASAWPTSQRR